MLIRDLLAYKRNNTVVTIMPNKSLRDAAREMVTHNIGALIVTDDAGFLVGVLSERDLVRALTLFDAGLVEIPVSEIMTRAVITCEPHNSASEVLGVMNKNRIRHIPVTEDDKLLGVIGLRELDRAYRHLQSQALTDELTGLSNRRHFLQHLRQELSAYSRYGNPFSVAMLDIDHFKKVNDTYGHAAGDQVLVALADLLGNKLRLIDIAGRLGGEEFAILFPNTELPEAEKACQRLLKGIREEKIQTDAGLLSVTMSAGLTVSTANVGNGEALLKIADTLLYEAKAAGRDRVVSDLTSTNMQLEEVASQQIGSKTIN